MAALVGGLLLCGDDLIPTALAAPSPDPPLPPVRRAADNGPLDRLVKRIGDDSPLWQFVEPGDGSALWQLIERVGPDSALWERLEQAGPGSPLWERVERLGADNSVWDGLGQNGDDGHLNRLVERAGGDGPTWKPAGAERRSGPTFQELDEAGRAAAPLAATQAGSPANFVERCGFDNPLYGPLSYGYYGHYALYAAPTFVDIDGDGDFDAFVGELYGKGFCGYSQDDVRFFENFHYDDTYGDYGSAYFVEQCGYVNPLPLRVGGAFTATFPTPTFVDIDGDGDFDAFVGEQQGYSPIGAPYYGCGLSAYDVRFFENIGDPYTPVFTETCGAVNPLPLYSGSLFTATFPTPTFVDIDGDGDFDAFVGEQQGYSPTCGPSAYDVRFFLNTDLTLDHSNPTFVEQCGPANNPLSGVYPSYLPAPTFVDIDGDGDFDAFVGEVYGYGPCGPSAYDLRFFENTGDPNNPAFTERCGAANPLYSGVYGYYAGLGAFLRPMPTFVEIDGDGDFDAFVGELYGIGACGSTFGDVRFFENVPVPVGGVTEPASPLALLGPWLVSATAGVTGAIGAGAALLKRKRRKA
jgi:hypothetical protein